IMRFSAGEEDDIREGAYQYAKSSAQVLRHIDYFEKGKEVSCDFETFVRLFGSQKKMAISFFNLHKNRPFHTIEVRCPNGTINPLIWENNINFFTKLLLATTNNKKDWDLINYLYQESKNNCREDYEFNIDKATDLVDFVFDDEIDKNDFMIQYEKRNEKVLKLKR
ncbi:MAG TPA: hypothetical protein PLV83_02295, partial [Bacilli bacterium]|nr:hypothetical protein [Bacilli bacterium]